ncbi:flagellar motor protein MotA [Azospirillum sp. RWY-5-1]|uniref:Flagellar motor protein MotA n=1 Tax=Azospirillum oleiclasticum TaxID=2735135 RepID=A0ABX2TAZ8_9PROT|nr:MotA/TolQ/ExbB proton channel family protein [Azospirillum oleiclasticum]NYZ15225.1 flagellar motor protein MotA [Azospirillum oleiclasticum]NYZ21354.1 flagellar motor protein MotA [Azospirillum oleiclasticum]
MTSLRDTASGRAPAAPPRALRPRGGLDVATLVGLAAAVGVIVVAMTAGGSLRAFLDPPSLIVVLGGTLAVTTASFSLGDVVRAWRQAGQMLALTTHDPQAVGRQVLLLAEAARRAGPETLKGVLPDLRHDVFLQRSVALIVEGLPPDDIERMLTGEVEASGSARIKSAAVLRRASEVAPAMGLIGTLVGLVHMLGGLNDPSAIGPAMALALLTTFYGAVLGNVALAPLAAKLERAAEDEALIKTLYTIAAVSIARQENPRRLEMLLNAVLPPGKRLTHSERESPRGA